VLHLDDEKDFENLRLHEYEEDPVEEAIKAQYEESLRRTQPFKAITREIRERVSSLKYKIPAVGRYTPKYTQLNR